jgi:hypothetical protein
VTEKRAKQFLPRSFGIVVADQQYVKDLTESLILAQDKRWRRALSM